MAPVTNRTPLEGTMALQDKLLERLLVDEPVTVLLTLAQLAADDERAREDARVLWGLTGLDGADWDDLMTVLGHQRRWGRVQNDPDGYEQAWLAENPGATTVWHPNQIGLTISEHAAIRAKAWDDEARNTVAHVVRRAQRLHKWAPNTG